VKNAADCENDRGPRHAMRLILGDNIQKGPMRFMVKGKGGCP